jgi:hypothetical protein
VLRTVSGKKRVVIRAQGGLGIWCVDGVVSPDTLWQPFLTGLKL